MNPDPLARYLQRLPTLVTFFFSVMLVTVFKELSTIFHWTTAPSFNIFDLSHILIVLSFIATLFFVVSVWLGYSLLIERFPYTLDYTTFFFDVARFSVLFMIFNFSFLAGNPPNYVYYLAALGVFHSLMAGWHSYRLRLIDGPERVERASDVRGHFFRAATYFGLGILYYVFVSSSWETSGPWILHTVFVFITMGLLVYWNLARMLELRQKALQAQEAAKLHQAAAASAAK